MEIIVADANIFVYLFQCGLLERFLSNDRYQIRIAQAVFNELTGNRRRISRDNPELRGIILSVIHNHSAPTSLKIVDITTELHNAFSLQIYFQLYDNGELDPGEIESIPLSIELNGRFLSHDIDAIVAANKIQRGLGITFLDFCNELFDNGFITQTEFLSIQNFTRLNL